MAWRLSVGLAALCFAAAHGIGLDTVRGQESQATGSTQVEKPQPLGRVSVNVVFAGGNEFIEAAKTSCQDLQSDKLQDCFAKEMKKAKASTAAVEFSKQLGEPGFVRDFKAAGPVDIAYILYPYRANENQSCLIVNGNPPLIDVDNHKLVGAGALKYNATYLSLARTHKDISLWPSDRYSTETPDVEMGTNAGAHIIVNYRLREKCHACAVLGHAWYSFDFDSKGKFGGARFIGVSVTPQRAAVDRPAANKTVSTAVGDEVTIALPVKAGGNSEWMLASGLDTQKVRLIEHSHVAPPTKTGAPGTEEFWKFAMLGTGTTTIELQKMNETGKEATKPVKFRVVIRGSAAGASGAAPEKE